MLSIKFDLIAKLFAIKFDLVVKLFAALIRFTDMSLTIRYVFHINMPQAGFERGSKRHSAT